MPKNKDEKKSTEADGEASILSQYQLAQIIEAMTPREILNFMQVSKAARDLIVSQKRSQGGGKEHHIAGVINWKKFGANDYDDFVSRCKKLSDDLKDSVLDGAYSLPKAELIHKISKMDLDARRAYLLSKDLITQQQLNSLTEESRANLLSTYGVLGLELKVVTADQVVRLAGGEIINAHVDAYFDMLFRDDGIVEKLINAKADINNAVDEDGHTALMFAARFGHTEVAQTLIDKGANVNAVDEDGNTALIVAAANGHMEIVEKLVEAKADLNAADKSGDTALILAVREGHMEIVEKLVEAKADLNAVYQDGHTALILAARYRRTDIAEKLIEAGADLNAADKSGDTALILAVRYRRTDIAEKLIEAGANVNVADKDRRTALTWAIESGLTDIAQKLIDAEADLKAFDQYGRTALNLAVTYQCTEVVQKLIDKGANVNARGEFGDTALILAAENGHTEVVEKLIEAKADVNNAEKYGGDTALMKAAERGHMEIALRLINAGADFNKKDLRQPIFDFLESKVSERPELQEFIRDANDPQTTLGKFFRYKQGGAGFFTDKQAEEWDNKISDLYKTICPDSSSSYRP